MPPKKNEPGKKTIEKKKEKVIEDKTFGLKNKKGAKQQRYIQNVTQQVKFGNQKASKLAQQEADKNKKKLDKKKESDELNSLFRPVQTVSKGADPKSVLCAFFKQGQCSKGAKCKFSHDLNVERKGEKINIYADTRDEKEETMENWDEDQLRDVVNKKHGEQEKSLPKTAIICKFFLEAVESSKYGWFWECPNGGKKCHYRHALPPGFVLKKDQKKEDKGEIITIEELIEKERAALGGGTTKVTLESFLKWKERKRKEKIALAKAAQDKKKADYKAGRAFGISGREMFEFNPDLVGADDDEAAEGVIERERDSEDEDESTEKVYDINLDYIMSSARESDGSGTVATERQFQVTASGGGDPSSTGSNEKDEAVKLDEAAALPPTAAATETDAAIAAAMAATVNGVDLEIDEELFGGDDIDDVEDELENLDLVDE
ncbi:zinc finger CCCH domain-containing protein 15-like [Crassostrea virginica]|uniref:Zinc finger CCCH domain-containing protein 15 n=1 Tax=Crassostrea virginica TaxID=6565 RepID=A0A8B8DHA6_CRAVI|nr:zinc finger CCCH domain-containing protein 15-like [Crassostrea virginica]